MQYTYGYVSLIHIPISKPIGDENSEHCPFKIPKDKFNGTVKLCLLSNVLVLSRNVVQFVRFVINSNSLYLAKNERRRFVAQVFPLSRPI